MNLKKFRSIVQNRLKKIFPESGIEPEFGKNHAY